MATLNILNLINKSNGWIGFDKFMFEALFRKGFGYYNKPISKNSFGPFGCKGDFITSPMMGPWIGKTLAKNFIDLKNQAPRHLANKLIIREIGAGTGHLAAEILVSLTHTNKLPQSYEIIEINDSMIHLQKRVITETLKKNFNTSYSNIVGLVKWRTSFINEENYFDCKNQSEISGMIIANELVDSFPTKIFKFIPSGKKLKPLVYEYGVSVEKNKNFYWSERIASEKLANAVKNRFDESIKRGFPWSQERLGEWSPYISNWSKQIINKISWGQLIIIDYGKERYELDYPTRVESSLTAYRDNKQFNDLKECLKNPGIQDLTCQVDFSEIVEALSKNDKVELAIKTQAAWMLDAGILEEAERICFGDNINLQSEHYDLISSLQNLLSDATMGQSFLVLEAKKTN